GCLRRAGNLHCRPERHDRLQAHRPDHRPGLAGKIPAGHSATEKCEVIMKLIALKLCPAFIPILLLIVNLVGTVLPAYADPQPGSGSETLLAFKDAQTKDRYNSLLEQLRCLVCQNQSLADSDA